MTDQNRILPGLVRISQSEGSLGTDEVQISHNGTKATIESKDGNLDIIVPSGARIVLDGVQWPAADGTASQYLQTNGSGSASWTTLSLSLDNLSDVIISTATIGDVIYFNGTNWVNSQPGATSGVQPYDADLSTLAGLAQSAGNFIVSNGTAWTVQSGNTARTSLGLGTSNSPTFSSVSVTTGTASTSITTPTVNRGGTGNASLYTDIGANNLTLGGTTSTVIVAGDLQVDGTTTTINSTNLDVVDKNITVNHGGNTAGATTSGINIEGDSAAVVGYFRSGSDNSNLEFKAPTGSALTLDVNAATTLQLNTGTTGHLIRYNGTNFVNAFAALDDLSDVVIATPTTDQLLKYDGTNWTNQTVTIGTGDLTGPGSSADNAIVRFDGTTGKLVKNSGAILDNSGNGTFTTLAVSNGTTTRANLGLAIGTDVQAHDTDLDTIAGLSHTTGNVIRSNGTVWQSTTVSLDDLGDVAISAPANNQILKYNGTTWVNGTAGASGDPLDVYFNPANTVVSRNALTGTSVTNGYQYTGTGRAVVTSINVANVNGTTETAVSGIINDNSVGTDYYIGKIIPIPANTSLELLRRPKVLEPNDQLKFQADIANNLEIVVTVAPFDTNTKLYNAFYHADSGAVGTNVTVYTESNSAGSVIDSILVANTQTGTTGVAVTVILNDGTNDTKLISTMNIPQKSSVELCDGPKFLPNTGTIKIQVSDADRCEISVCGRKL